jgi:hypothetical protein
VLGRPGEDPHRRAAVLVNDPSQIGRMFEPVVEACRGRGVSSTEPEILRIDRLTEGLVATDVRWP